METPASCPSNSSSDWGQWHQTWNHERVPKLRDRNTFEAFQLELEVLIWNWLEICPSKVRHWSNILKVRRPPCIWLARLRGSWPWLCPLRSSLNWRKKRVLKHDHFFREINSHLNCVVVWFVTPKCHTLFMHFLKKKNDVLFSTLVKNRVKLFQEVHYFSWIEMLEKNILFMQSLFMLLKVIHLVVQKTWAAKIYGSMLSTLRRSIIVKSMCRNFSNSFLLLFRFRNYQTINCMQECTIKMSAISREN